MDKQTILYTVFQAELEGNLPISIYLEDNLEDFYKSIYKKLSRMGKNKTIGMSLDKDNNLLWFRKKKTT